jgi:hypothetical protein
VVAAHNHVLRRWLRGDSLEPVAEVDDAMHQVIKLFTVPVIDAGDPGTTVVAFRSGQNIDALLPALRRLTDEAPE